MDIASFVVAQLLSSQKDPVVIVSHFLYDDNILTKHLPYYLRTDDLKILDGSNNVILFSPTLNV